MYRTHADDLAACQVDANHGIPMRQRHLTDSRALLQPSLVDEDVTRSEFLDHPPEHRLRLIQICRLSSEQSVSPLTLAETRSLLMAQRRIPVGERRVRRLEQLRSQCTAATICRNSVSGRL